MLKNNIKSLILCPYCQGSFRFKYRDRSSLWGVLKCTCDEFPILNGIYFIKKDDNCTNRKIVELLKKDSRYKALKLALSDVSKRNRFIFLLCYFLKNIGLSIQLKHFLNLLRIFGTTNAWFKKLISRETQSDMLVAFTLLKNRLSKTNVVADMGAGIGTLAMSFINNKVNLPKNYLAIDKAFSGLFISSMFINHSSFIRICTDIEERLLIRNLTLDACFIVDAFPQIKNKKRTLADISTALKKNSTLTIVNLYKTSNLSKYWGYGISPNDIFLLLSKNFSKIQFVDNKLSLSGKIHLLSKEKAPTIGYSLIAVRK